MKVYIKYVGDQFIPQKAHHTDTGYDIFAASDPIIHGKLAPQSHNNTKDLKVDIWSRIDYIEYKTNVFLNLADDARVYVNLRPRSSIRKYNLLLCNSLGLCDNGYTGEYIVSFRYIMQPEDFVYPSGIWVNPDRLYKKGDKIAQLEFLRGNEYVHFVKLDKEQFEALEMRSTRKSGGHGSTGNS